MNAYFFNFIFTLSVFNFFSLSYAEIEELTAQIVNTYPHNPLDFTQGLISEGDIVYESCGLYGHSRLKKYELDTGKILKEVKLPAEYFAEGIAICRNKLIQLTWKEGKALIYNLKNLSLKEEIKYQGQGWGLCTDKDAIWMSNGSDKLVCRDPITFEIKKTISVRANQKTIGFLNDLICVDNYLYVNVLGEDSILRIHKETGEVTGRIDASQLFSKQQKAKLAFGAVLNGIAYRKEKQTFLVTGKYWPTLFEVRFIPKN